jgi:drug/metabolite transporter (DMT)-like permease
VFNLRPKNLGYILLLLNAILWGIAPPIIKFGLISIDPFVFLLVRFIFASLLFLPIVLYHVSRHPRQHYSIPKVTLLALLGVPLTLTPLFLGIDMISSFEASILEASSPIFTIILSAIIIQEKIRKREKLGLVTVLAGTLIILFSHQDVSFAGSVIGFSLILLSNVIWSAFLILSRKFHAPPIIVTFTAFVISIPFFLTLSLFFSPQDLYLIPSIIQSNQIWPILYMAVFGSIIAFWCYQQALKYIQPGEASIFSYLKPVFTLPLSFLWLQEPFNLVMLMGCLIVVAGVYISEEPLKHFKLAS